MKTIISRVKKGDGIGKTLNSPTANLDISVADTGLPEGVYAAWVKFKNKDYPGALVILEKLNKVEVRLMNYEGEDFYGEEIEVEVVGKVSRIIEIKHEEKLKQKIVKDMERVRKMLTF